MGHKIMLTAFLLSCCLLANADGNYVPGASLYYSQDTEDNIVRKISAELWFDQEPKHDLATQEWGVQYTDLYYENPLRSHSGQAVSLLIDKRENDTWYMGQAGIAQLDGNTFITGDLSFLHFVNRNLLVSGGVFNDVIDSPRGLDAGLTVGGIYAGFEAYNDIGGLTSNLMYRKMSDGNSRPSIISKAYLSLGWGFNAYVANEYFRSERDSDLYWSPDEFNRVDLGIGFRKRIFGGKHLITGTYDVGKINTNGFRDGVNSWYLTYEHNRKSRMRIQGRIGQDIGAFGYDFTFLSLGFRLAL
jgi:hypothetical protein